MKRLNLTLAETDYDEFRELAAHHHLLLSTYVKQLILKHKESIIEKNNER